MSRPQIVLTILGAVLIIVLFSLPKVVVDNDGEMAAEAQAVPQSGNTPEEAGEVHQIELSDSDQQKIQYFKEQLKNQNNSTIFADSLAKAYLFYQEIDSVAKYADMMVAADPSVLVLEKAGNYYYDAFGFAVDEASAARFGNKVRELLGEVLKRDPNNLKAKSKIAMTYVSSANPMQGILMLREVLEQDPQNEDALFNMGILSLQSAQYDKAAERLEALLKVNPEHFQAMFYLGVSYKELNNKQEAIKWLTKAKETGNDPAVSAAVDSYLLDLK